MKLELSKLPAGFLGCGLWIGRMSPGSRLFWLTTPFLGLLCSSLSALRGDLRPSSASNGGIESGVTLSGTGCSILGSCSTDDLWKSKLTGLGPGDETELVGESTNLVHSLLLCGEEGSPGGGERLGGLSSTWGAGGGSVVGGPLLGGVGEERLSSGGWSTGGKTSGRGMLLRRSTTKCMAVLNSSRERAPSLDTSESCLDKNQI